MKRQERLAGKQEQLKKLHKAKAKKARVAAVPLSPEAGLAWLLSPVDVATFRAEYLERQPLHIPRNSPYYDAVSGVGRNLRATTSLTVPPQVLTTADVRAQLDALCAGDDALVLKTDLNVCKVVDGRRVNWPHTSPAAEAAANGEDAEAALTAAEAWEAYERGYTLQVFQPQQHCLALARLMSRLEDTFGSLCGANSYLTPPGTQGLAPHYDDVDVYILQARVRGCHVCASLTSLTVAPD